MSRSEPVGGSVTLWLRSLRRGDDAAARQLWDRFFDRVVQLARRHFGSRPRRAVDEEDVALSVLDTLVRGAAEGRFTQLEDNRDLWCLLAAITLKKVQNVRRRELRRKRGGGTVRGDSVLHSRQKQGQTMTFDDFAAADPTPEFLVMLEDEHRHLCGLLRDDTLRQVVAAVLEGYTVSEIADRLNVSTRTIQRKVNLIRAKWAKALGP